MENAGITDEFCRFEPRLTNLNYFISSVYVYFYSQTVFGYTFLCGEGMSAVPRYIVELRGADIKFKIYTC